MTTPGAGRTMFAGVLLLIGGTLNVIYGIGAISNSRFFAANTHYVFGDLNTWGWITLILGVVQFAAATSLFAGGAFGRWFAIGAASLTTLGALLAIPAYPFLSLAIFGLSLWVISGLTIYADSSTPAH